MTQTVDVVDPRLRCPRCGKLDFPQGHRCDEEKEEEKWPLLDPVVPRP